MLTLYTLLYDQNENARRPWKDSVKDSPEKTWRQSMDGMKRFGRKRVVAAKPKGINENIQIQRDVIRRLL